MNRVGGNVAIPPVATKVLSSRSAAMNDTLILVSLLGLVGLFLGAWLQRQGPARRRQAALLGLTLVLLPVGALVLSGALGR